MSKSNHIRQFEIALLQNNVPNELNRPSNDDGEKHKEIQMERKQLAQVEPNEENHEEKSFSFK